MPRGTAHPPPQTTRFRDYHRRTKASNTRRGRVPHLAAISEVILPPSVLYKGV